jgi:adenylate cyclase
VDQVGQELGVRHVLEGSVRKAGDRVRITAQLVDAKTGGHLWAERYDRDLKDIFGLQDEVTQKIVAALAVKLTEDEQKRLECRYTDNLEAYDYFMRGLEYLYRFTKEANDQARSMFQRAIDLDPKFAAAHVYIGWNHWWEWTLGWSQNPQSLERAYELAQKALALDDSLPEAHTLLGNLYLWKKLHDQAIVAKEKAISLNPNFADAIAALGDILAWAGRPEEAIGFINRAMRLNPIYPVWYLWGLSHAYFLTGQYDEAIAAFKSVLNRNPNFHPAHIYLAIIYSELGRVEEAQAEAAEFMRMSALTSWEAWRERLPYKDQAVLERLFQALLKAGLKPW